MVSEQQLAIACRYVPYDQWFITHINPSWKIRHLKQRILAKCLNLPFDPRFIQKDVTPNARPPSPITFAPDATIKMDSPITEGVGDDQESTGPTGGGGDEGYEEDDERDQDFNVLGPKFKLKSKPSSPPPFHVRLQQQQQQKQEPQIATHTYMLFRFSTCQILEENFQISWYDIQPHELVELHSSFSPPNFASSVALPTSIPSSPANIIALPQTKPAQKKPSSSTIPYQADTLTPSLTALPRHMPNSYIQPYWQGWVRALRVIWRTRPTLASDDPPVKDEGSNERVDRRHGETIEWRERWVVIHDGIVNICKSPTDPDPTRFPLSSLTALRGPEYLSHSAYTRSPTSQPQSNPRTPERSTTTARPLPTSSNINMSSSATSENPSKQETGDNIPNKDPKRNTRSLKKPRKDGKQQLFSTVSSPSLRTVGQDHQPHRIPSYNTPLATSNPKLKSTSLLTPEDRDREGEKALERRERDAESLKKWDDLGFSFALGGKDKSKSKGKEKDRERDDRERELRRILPALQHTAQDRSRSKSLRDKTFIPTSREEAEQAGMKVICVKFRIQPAGGEEDKIVGSDGAFPKTRRYTNTGPSLALIAASAPTAGTKSKTKSTTEPQVVIDSDVYVGESPSEDFARQPPAPGILISSSRTPATIGIDSASTYHPWNFFAGIKEEHKATEKRNDGLLLPSSTGAAEDFEAPATISSSSWKYQKLEKGKDINRSRSTGFGGEGDEEGRTGITTELSDMIAPSVSMTTRPTLVIPILTPDLVATTTSIASSISPESQPNLQTLNQACDSDSSSSISVSSPVFAHSANESDLDDEKYGSGAAGGMSGISGRSRKGYRYGGYHVQMKKAKSIGEDERLAGSARRTTAVENDGQPQQARREEKEKKREDKDEEREGCIALDMVNDNAFNSILRILHRHSSPSLSSSFTHSHTIIGSLQPSIPNNLPEDLPHHGFNDQVVPSDTDDDGRYGATGKNLAKRSTAIHPPILESLTARTANHSTQQPFYVALPYPEWRLELVKRARRAGMREMGRPLDLALHGWGREFEEMAAAARERKLERERELEREKKNKRKSAQSHVSTIKERRRKGSRIIGGSDADDDEDGDEDGDGDEEEVMGGTQLDSDSEEESDTEWLAWMTDLPRQFLVQRSQLAAQTAQTSGPFFTNPFSSSSLLEGDDNGPVRPRTQEEERILHADKIRKLEPTAISTVDHPPYLLSPSASLLDSSNQPPTLSPHSSFESLGHQRSSSSHNSAPFPGFSSVDDLLVNKSHHFRSQSRSLQHLRSHRHVGSVPEEGGDGYNTTVALSSSRQGLHHSSSVDRHFSSRRNEVDSNGQLDLDESNPFALGKPILTNEQIMQIESEVFASPVSSLPSHWTFPPIPIPSPPPRSQLSISYTSSTSTSSTSTARPPAASASISGEIKAPSSVSAISRFTPDRWSGSLGTSLSMPSSPSASTTTSPNSTSPTRSSVFGTLGRSPSLMGKVGGQEKEKKGFLLRKRMSRDLAKDKDREKDTNESPLPSPAAGSMKRRPKLLLPASASLPSSSSIQQYHPEIRSPTHNPNHSYHSPGATMLSARTLLRHVRSGSSLRGEEGSATASPTVVPRETEVKEVQKKKKGPINRIVRGFDSSLAFAEGR